MGKDMQNEMETGVVQGFLGIITHVMVLDPKCSYGIGHFKIKFKMTSVILLHPIVGFPKASKGVLQCKVWFL